MKQAFWSLLLIAALWGCAMLGPWRAIPPPGGCDRCHTRPISADWQVSFSPVVLTDETGREPWLGVESILPPEPSPLEQMKLTEERCFRCHKEPDQAHRQYRGRYHHK